MTLLRRVALVAAAATLTFCANASGETITGQIQDPRDTPQDVNGAYNHADIEQVRVAYDSAGSLSVTVRFFDAVPQTAEGNIMMKVATGTLSYDLCDGEFSAGAASLSFSPQQDPASGTGLFTIQGLEGSIPTTRSISADGHEVTVQATHPALANRAYTCAGAADYGYTYESFRCNDHGCYDYRRHTIDATSPFLIASPPAPPTPVPQPQPVTPQPPALAQSTECSDGEDNDGDGLYDSEDPGCVDPSDDSEDPYNAPKLPTLTAYDAKHYMQVALKRRFKNSYAYGYARRLADCRRLTRVRYRCTASWIIGDFTFVGPVTIWLSAGSDSAEWNYGWTIRRYDEYCMDRKRHGDRAYRGKSCVKTLRVT